MKINKLKDFVMDLILIIASLLSYSLMIILFLLMFNSCLIGHFLGFLPLITPGISLIITLFTGTIMLILVEEYEHARWVFTLLLITLVMVVVI